MRNVNLIPMAGAGQRFVDEGYTVPKPLIEVDGEPMIIKAAECLPPADHWIFICRKEHVVEHGIDEKLKKLFPCSDIISVGYLTEGQASTCLLARDHLQAQDRLTIGACDNAMEYDQSNFKNHIAEYDALVWTFRNNPAVIENPKMYGWVQLWDDGRAKKISCKQPISENPLQDHALIGAFSFREAGGFIKSVDSMIAKNRRINNEFYMDVAMDECIRMDYDVRPMEVNNYTCWGTPEDLEKYKNKK